MGIYTSIQVKPIGYAGDNLIPAVSESGTLSFPESEKTVGSFTANNIKIMGQSAGRWLCDFGMEYIPENNAWNISITDKRIAFISKYIPSFFSGSAVIKKSKVSVGQIEIKNIENIKIDASAKPSILSICYRRTDGAELYLIIEAPVEKLNEIKALSSTLTDNGGL